MLGALPSLLLGNDTENETLDPFGPWLDASYSSEK
jgi:hypothetical protein